MFSHETYLIKNPLLTSYSDSSSGKFVQYTLHRDKRAGTSLRGKVFGHTERIISFSEGLLAKQLNERELKFYSFYRKQLDSILPQEYIPDVLGIAFVVSDSEEQTVLDFCPSLKVGHDSRIPMLLQKDIAAGYQKPAILDLKIGIRTWMFGDNQEIIDERTEKLVNGTCPITNFRVRAGMWYSDKEKYQKVEGLAVVTRKFGNKCSMDELIEFFKDFLKHKGSIKVFTEKLRILKEALTKVRNSYGVRFFSSSILMVYDEANPEKMDLRMLDFEKTYFDIEKVAEQYNEALNECEDGVINAIDNLTKILESL